MIINSKLAILANILFLMLMGMSDGVAASAGKAVLPAVIGAYGLYAPLVLFSAFALKANAQSASGTVVDSLVCPELPTLVCLGDSGLHSWVGKIVCVSHGEDGIAPEHLKEDVLRSGCNCSKQSCSQLPLATEFPHLVQSSPASLTVPGDITSQAPTFGTGKSSSTYQNWGESLSNFVTAGTCTEVTTVQACATSARGGGAPRSTSTAVRLAQVFDNAVATGADSAASALPVTTGPSKRRKSRFPTLIPEKPYPHPNKYCSKGTCGSDYVCCGAFCIPQYAAASCRVPVRERLPLAPHGKRLPSAAVDEKLPIFIDYIGLVNNVIETGTGVKNRRADPEAVFILPSEDFTTTLMPEATATEQSYYSTVTESLTAYLIPQQGEYASISIASPSTDSYSVPVVDKIHVTIDPVTSDVVSTIVVCINKTVTVFPTANSTAAAASASNTNTPLTLCFDSANPNGVACPTTVQVTLNASSAETSASVLTTNPIYSNASLIASVAPATASNASNTSTGTGTGNTTTAPVTSMPSTTGAATSTGSESSASIICFDSAMQRPGPCTTTSATSTTAFNDTSMTIAAGAGHKASTVEPPFHAIALFIAALLF